MRDTNDFPRHCCRVPPTLCQLSTATLATSTATPRASASTTLQYTGIATFVAIVLYAVLYYSRSFNSVFLTRRHGANSNAAMAGAGDAVTAHPGPMQALGLGPDDVAVLPTFTYHAASPESRANAKATTTAAAVADCYVVCLDELREGALVRMLPSCKHYLHADCVDVWLLSHVTCPVCRGSPGPEKVRLGVASLSPPLPQLRRFGPAPSEGGETSGAKDAVPPRSPSPVRSPMRFELMVATGNGSAAMSPSPPRPRTPDGGMCRTRSPSPEPLEPHSV